jgi:hypothetical protein
VVEPPQHAVDTTGTSDQQAILALIICEGLAELFRTRPGIIVRPTLEDCCMNQIVVMNWFVKLIQSKLCMYKDVLFFDALNNSTSPCK